jgi:hypothetical protein
VFLGKQKQDRALEGEGKPSSLRFAAALQKGKTEVHRTREYHSDSEWRMDDSVMLRSGESGKQTG